MSDIILHHYPPSPVAEKIRKGFAIKNLAWVSVVENRLPPRPELFAMTGGYRRIPVMQIGADLYCDTQVIFRELEERYPKPTFFPFSSNGIPFALSRWTDGELFTTAFRMVLAPTYQNLPPEFIADRGRLYLGKNYDMAKEAADMPHILAQFRAQIGWLEERLSSTGPYLLGDQPGMPDLLIWYLVWFIRQRAENAAAILSEFQLLNLWETRMDALGYGTQTEMTGADALTIARNAAPQTLQAEDPLDPQGLKPGMRATIEPLTESGEKPISGTIRAVGRDRVVLIVTSDECGETAVHFPRVGYRVTPLV